MQCFARWKIDTHHNLYFRAQTILQYGDSWSLLANFVLLNPGSAVPLNESSYNQYLEEMNLPFFVKAKKNEFYYKFSIDRLMSDLLRLYSSTYSGGVIRLYNLFNLRNQDSTGAIEQFKENKNHVNMFSLKDEIMYGEAPVVIASGRHAYSDPLLTDELKRYIRIAKPHQLYSISRAGDLLFSIKEAAPDENGVINSYHPSYTFKYGNETVFNNQSNTIQ